MHKSRYPKSTSVLLLVSALAACSEKTPAPVDAAPLVLTQKAVMGDVRTPLTFAGEVRARSESALGFRVGGKIIERLVDVGAAIKPGMPLARMDARDFQLNSAATRSQVAAAQADVVQAQADYTRYNDLYQKNFVSAAEIDKRKATLDVAQARLAQAHAQLRVADNQGSYAVLAADRAGVITTIDADVGQVVSAGQTVMRIARDGEKEILIAVPENQLAEIQAAQKIEVTLWAAPDKRYAGRVREVSPGADSVTRTYAVRIAVANSDASMHLGMTASVLLHQATAADTVVLPLTALYQQGEKTALWVVDTGTHTVRLTPVKVGVFRENSVTIMAGVKAGDEIVTAGVHKLSAGQKVRLASDATVRK